MELDVRVNDASLAITLDDPFHLDLDSLMERIGAFAGSQGCTLNGLDVKGLLPRMVKGIAGCEAGCPADAKRVVRQGFQSFALDYIEGGILSATASLPEGAKLAIRLFPEF